MIREIENRLNKMTESTLVGSMPAWSHEQAPLLVKIALIDTHNDEYVFSNVFSHYYASVVVMGQIEREFPSAFIYMVDAEEEHS